MKIKKYSLPLLFFVVFLLSISNAHANITIDIYGPAQQIVKLAIASPLKAPDTLASNNGVKLNEAIQKNLTFLPFMELTPDASILGGKVLSGWQEEDIDFKRFQIAGADLLITQAWPKGDGNASTVEVRVFETSLGKFIFGSSYNNVHSDNINQVADKFCADLMKYFTGHGEFFLSTLAFAKNASSRKRDIWVVNPTGRNLKKITNLNGTAMSPSWSPDGRYIVFSHLDDITHGLGVWDRASNTVKRIRFPGNTVIGPTFMPDNKVAVGLSTSGYPDIFLLNYKFGREKPLEQTSAINVSPSFNRDGTKMAFTSSRLGGPQIFLKDLTKGTVSRVSMNGTYNTEPSLSPDGTLVAYTRLTDQGHRIFVQDMITGEEKQVSFGPGNDEQPSFSPDSYFVAFSSSRTGTQQIYLTTRHGGTAKHIPTGQGAATFPRWGLIPDDTQR